MLGIKDLNFKIFQELNDKDLMKLASVNKELNHLCKDETFWMNRTIKKFGYILDGAEEMRKYKEINNKENISWKEYYINLVKFVDKIYSTPDHYSELETYMESLEIEPFDDKLIIYQYIYYTTYDIQENYIMKLIERRDDRWMDDPFIDISKLFFHITGDFLDDKETLLFLLDKLLDRDNFKLTRDVVSDITGMIGKEGLDLVLKKRKLQYIPINDLDLVNYEYGDSDTNLQLIVGYMCKEDILYSLFNSFHYFYGNVEILLNSAINKGATASQIIKSMELIPMDTDNIENHVENLDAVKDVLQNMGLSNEDKNALKDFALRRVNSNITDENFVDVYFEVLKVR